jgi:hypothetical protein
MIPALLLAATQAAADPGRGFQYVCEATRPLADGGAVAGTVTVADGGAVTEARVAAQPKLQPLDLLFLRRDVPGDAPASRTRWSVVWQQNGLPAPALRFDAGLVEIDVSRRRRLPRGVALALRRDRLDAAALVALSVRWPGVPSGAPFGFRLGPLLGFAGGAPALDWTMARAPLAALPPPFRAVLAEGRLKLDPLRAVRPAFDGVVADLAARAASPRTACRREAVEENPLAEI